MEKCWIDKMKMAEIDFLIAVERGDENEKTSRE